MSVIVKVENALKIYEENKVCHGTGYVALTGVAFNGSQNELKNIRSSSVLLLFLRRNAKMIFRAAMVTKTIPKSVISFHLYSAQRYSVSAFYT